MECPYCNDKLEVKESVFKIGSFNIECGSCGAIWVDEDDVEK